MSNAPTYLDCLTEELAKKFTESSVWPGSVHHASLLADAALHLLPDLGVDERASDAWVAVMSEAEENGIKPLVMNILCIGLSVGAFGTVGQSA